MTRRFVIDSSLAVSWCIADESNDMPDTVLGELRSGATALCPPLWIWETNNALLQAERRGRVSAEERHRQLLLLQNLPIGIDDAAHLRVWNDVSKLAEKYRLTIYDATYLEMALRHDLSLGTLDRDLRKAAENSHVTCLPEKLS